MRILNRSKLFLAIMFVVFAVAMAVVRFVVDPGQGVWPKVSAVGFIIWFLHMAHHNFEWSMSDQQPALSKLAQLFQMGGIGLAIVGLIGGWLS